MKKKEGYWSRIKNKYIKIRQYYRSKILIYEALSLSIASIIILGSVLYGWHHKNDIQYKRAMTISDVNQELNFTKTGVQAKLREQKRYHDMTVIPINISSEDRQSFNAEDYLVAIMPLKKDTTKEKLEESVSASFVSFGANGETAIVLKGELPKEPLQIILRNDNNFSESNDGSGQLDIDGKTTEVDYNAISFTVNPKGNNVKKDSSISQDMKMSDLYLTSIGNKQFKQIDFEEKTSIKKQHRLEDKKSTFEDSINKMNQALNKEKNDFKADESTSDSDTTTSSVTTNDVEEFDDTNMEGSDIESLRNTAIAKLEVINQDISTTKDDQDALNRERNDKIDYTKKVFDLVTITNKYKIIDKE